ncbi:MAG: zf-HC2 domain-containing protein [Chloroflexota bacterium]|nr:zf-HC2 domain-containing protein [Chloroflexota bacterium]
MNRDDVHLSEETLNMYLDGELSAGERECVAVHLAVCDECRAEVTALQGLFTALEKLELAPAPSPDLVMAVAARIQPRRRLHSLWLVLTLQTAIALALLAWGWTRLVGYWTVTGDFLSSWASADTWAEISSRVTAWWGLLFTWATSQWAARPTWSDLRWWFARLPAFDGSRLSPVQLAVLGAALVTIWLFVNALLLHRASLNGRVINE